MRPLLLTLIVLGAAAPALAFDPAKPLAVMVHSPVAPGTAGRTIQCGLGIDLSKADLDGGLGRYPVVFDCGIDPVPIQLESVGDDRLAVMTINPATGRRCYIQEEDIPGNNSRRIAFWNCQTTQYAEFLAMEDATGVFMRRGRCGLGLNENQRSQHGVSLRFRAFLDCEHVWGIPLQVENFRHFLNRLDDVTPFTSKGCPSLGSAPGSSASQSFRALLRRACAIQDACYTNPWQEKNRCDDLLMEEMLATCEASFEAGDSQRTACVATANRYLLAAAGDVKRFDKLQARVKKAIRNGLVLLRFD